MLISLSCRGTTGKGSNCLHSLFSIQLISRVSREGDRDCHRHCWIRRDIPRAVAIHSPLHLSNTFISNPLSFFATTSRPALGLLFLSNRYRVTFPRGLNWSKNQCHMELTSIILCVFAECCLTMHCIVPFTQQGERCRYNDWLRTV